MLLGIPGNHDWYDGLDGFARMFRRPDERIEEAVAPHKKRRSRLRRDRKRAERPASSRGSSTWTRSGGLFRLLLELGRSIRAFYKGEGKRVRKRLVLHGYEAVQDC